MGSLGGGGASCVAFWVLDEGECALIADLDGRGMRGVIGKRTSGATGTRALAFKRSEIIFASISSSCRLIRSLAAACAGLVGADLSVEPRGVSFIGAACVGGVAGPAASERTLVIAFSVFDNESDI